MNTRNKSDFEYDVALSFAGEDRTHAEQLRQLLERRGVRVFYDKAEQANLWGKDLYQHLADVYSNQARFCVVFISSHYLQKAWTQHEIRNAQPRAFRSGEDYILPLRLDDTSLPGLTETIGYLDLRRVAIEQVADSVVKKLEDLGTSVVKPVSPAASFSKDGGAHDIPLPKIKRQSSDYEKGQFLKESFEFIKQYFQRAASALQTQYSDISVDFTDVHSRKFACMVYLGGKLKSQCKVWIGGGMLSSDSICYSEGKVNFDNDNSYNDMLSIEDTGFELRLRSIMGQFHQSGGESVMNRDIAAEYLWKRFTNPLTY